jgi:hypothetical protein
MENIKYTTDGKKVAIVGKLNNTETIVQEIYVSDGNEIPAGENFIVKTLLDKPAVSWKEKNLADLEARYQSEKADIERRTKGLKEALRAQIPILRGKIKNLQGFCSSATAKELERLESFLAGEYKYMVKLCYHSQILAFDDSVAAVERYESDTGIKLLSLFGKSDGSLSWRLSQYRDGSGSSSEFHPAKTLEEAKELLNNYIDAKESYNSYDVAEIRKHNLFFDFNKLDAFRIKSEEGMLKNIADTEAKLAKQKAEFIELQKKYPQL